MARAEAAVASPMVRIRMMRIDVTVADEDSLVSVRVRRQGFAFWYFYSRGPRVRHSGVDQRPSRPRISGSGDMIDNENVSH
jgi:hypothetical protein